MDTMAKNEAVALTAREAALIKHFRLLDEGYAKVTSEWTAFMVALTSAAPRGVKLEALLYSKGLTVADLAAMTGIGRRTLEKQIAKGETDFNVRQMDKIADALDMDGDIVNSVFFGKTGRGLHAQHPGEG